MIICYYRREFFSTKDLQKEIKVYLKYGYKIKHQFDGIVAILLNESETEQVSLLLKA